ncbi:MAG: family 1 glycosylhydrolase [Candidatus Sericytochromatia bacterium]
MKLLRSLTLAVSLLAAAPAIAQSDDRPPAPVGRANFLWGVSRSGFQNDGVAPSMDWALLEAGGKVKPSGKSVDFRGHMDADLDRAKSLGINAFRTSFEWARLEPEAGRYDAAEVAYCHRLLKGIKSRGMAPIIVLHHFVTPAWAYKDAGDGLLGWESERTVQAYLRYVDFVVKEFGHEIDVYITFNEPSTVLLGGYMVGHIQPHRVGPVPMMRGIQNMLNAHIGAYERIHAADPGAMVSLTEYNSFFQPTGQDFAAGLPYMPGQLLGLLLDKVKGWDGQPRVKHLDFLALHYYGSQDIGSATSFPVEPYRWGSKPQHFRDILRAYYETFRLPILVAENGFSTKNGEPRADGWSREAYMVAHIRELQEARHEGLPIMGYLYWTLTDNYEWGSFDPRFGLWSVEAAKGDMTRRETPAVGVYRDIIRHNGVTPELARRFPPPESAAAHAPVPRAVRPGVGDATRWTLD